MEKLIELLNERDIKDGSKRKRYFVPNRICWEGCDNSECSELLIISKKFGFIQRLVENDKIDLDKIDRQVRIYSYVDEYEEYDYVYPDNHRQLLMLLAIQDNPIEFLISILK